MLFTSGYENMTSRVQYAVCLLNEREASLEIFRVIQVFDRNKKKLYIRNKENIYSFKFYSPDQNKLLKLKIIKKLFKNIKIKNLF